MGMYKYIQQTLQKEYAERSPIYRQRVSAWRKGAVVERVDKPSNLPRARGLGYKAKPGYVIVRVRVGRGQRKRPHPWGGRKPAKNVAFRAPGKSLQSQAEEKAGRYFQNLEVLNSYWVGQDGNYKFFEVVLADPDAPTVKHDALKQRGRVFRGLTSSGRKHRGL